MIGAGMSDPVAFSISVNGGAEQEITVATGLYISAAAAVPALLGIDDFPVRVRIWVPSLQPDYPPLVFRIDEAGGQAKQVILWRYVGDGRSRHG